MTKKVKVKMLVDGVTLPETYLKQVPVKKVIDGKSFEVTKDTVAHRMVATKKGEVHLVDEATAANLCREHPTKGLNSEGKVGKGPRAAETAEPTEEEKKQKK